MKTLRLIFASVIILLFSQTSFAQLSLGGQASYISLGDNGSTFGLGLRGDFARTEKLGIFGGISYYMKHTNKYSVSAYPIGGGGGNSLALDAEDSYSILHATINLKYYFVGDYESSFGFYGFGGGGFMAIPFKTQFESYNKELYTVDDTEGKSTFKNFTIGLGLGLEKSLPFGSLFLEGNFNVPANQQNGRTVSVEIPASLNASFGIRIPLDN